MELKIMASCPNCKSTRVERLLSTDGTQWYRRCYACGWKSETFRNKQFDIIERMPLSEIKWQEKKRLKENLKNPKIGVLNNGCDQKS